MLHFNKSVYTYIYHLTGIKNSMYLCRTLPSVINMQDCAPQTGDQQRETLLKRFTQKHQSKNS